MIGDLPIGGMTQDAFNALMRDTDELLARGMTNEMLGVLRDPEVQGALQSGAGIQQILQVVAERAAALGQSGHEIISVITPLLGELAPPPVRSGMKFIQGTRAAGNHLLSTMSRENIVRQPLQAFVTSLKYLGAGGAIYAGYKGIERSASAIKQIGFMALDRLNHMIYGEENLTPEEKQDAETAKAAIKLVDTFVGEVKNADKVEGDEENLDKIKKLLKLQNLTPQKRINLEQHYEYNLLSVLKNRLANVINDQAPLSEFTTHSMKMRAVTPVVRGRPELVGTPYRVI
jgi:hypothetical protein